MDDDPMKISKAIKISRKCLGIVYQNIVFAIGIKLICLVFGRSRYCQYVVGHLCRCRCDDYRCPQRNSSAVCQKTVRQNDECFFYIENNIIENSTMTHNRYFRFQKAKTAPRPIRWRRYLLSFGSCCPVKRLTSEKLLKASAFFV